MMRENLYDVLRYDVERVKGSVIPFDMSRG
jgi:hypothetical protein